MASQSAIEEILFNLFPNPGFFMEIACWDGEHISQTVTLERHHGWEGICVDPFPRNFQNRKCPVLPVAINRDGLPRDYVKVTIDRRHGGDVSYFSGFKDNLKTHWPLIEEHCDYTITQVPCLSMPLLQRYHLVPKHIDFLSIDTEGSEIEILSSIDWSKSTFGLICFEHNMDEGVRAEAKQILNGAGYKYLTSTDIDDLYVPNNN